MMAKSQAVTASYRWTLNELLTSRSEHDEAYARRRPRSSGAQFWVFLLTGIVAACALLILHFNSPQSRILPMILSLIFTLLLMLCMLCGGYWLLRSSWLARIHTRLQFARRYERDKVINYRIDAEGLASNVEGLSEWHAKWSAFRGVTQTPKGFLFYSMDREYYWLPNHAFSSAGDMQVLSDLARQYAPQYLDMTK